MTKQENIDLHYPPSDKEILTYLEAAALLGIHPNTLMIMVKNGEIRCQKIGNKPRFRRSWIIDWMEEAPDPRAEWAKQAGLTV